ncbi:MAG TPA: hypothetical protein VFI44_02295 [Ornithinibacter sp.]|nr:hypothetical protein [Ornithinibacter sp.]
MTQWEHVSEEFARVSLAADEAPVGVDRVRAHEGALRLAQANGSFAEEFVARTDLTQALYHVPRDPQNLVHFAWLRRALEPEHGLDQGDRDAVLWRLKWAVDLVEDIPEVPLTSLVAAIDDVEAMFRADGYHLRPVHAARARLARATGDREGVQRELTAWLAEPRDSRSDCPACEHRDQSRVIAPDDPRRALDLLRPVVEGELTCGDEPRASLGDAAVLRLELGDVEGAVEAFRRAWHLAEADPKASHTVGQCLRVLLRLGNADRAVDLLLPRLGWLDHLHTPSARMWFAATAAHVLDRAGVVGLAPAEVAGRPVADTVGDLRRTAEEVAATFDARYGSTVLSDTLAAAHDDARVPTEPTLPPTRLPTTEAPRAGRRGAGAVTASADVVERADAVRTALETLDPAMEDHVRAWLRDRDTVLPVETTEQWAAVSFLDRVSAQDADHDRHRAVLQAALEAARRAGDEVAVLRCEGELAILDVAHGTRQDPTTGEPVREDTALAGDRRARDVAARLEQLGAPGEAAGMWRRVAWFGIPDDPAADIARAAAAYGTAGQRERQLLCEVEAVMAVAPSDPGSASARLDALEPEVADLPVLRAMLLDVRSRLARMAGDEEAALAHVRAALGVRGVPERARLPLLLGLCEVLVERSDYADLEEPAADLVAAATRLRDGVLLAHAQRFLGLAYVETGRPVEAAELLEAALPVLRETSPGLVGPVGWALGNALVGLGQWTGARTAFATAATAFEADGRVMESAHAQWRAGNAAWDADDAEAAASHYDAAVERARATATVDLYVEALRSRAALRADTEDLAAGVTELDDAIPQGQRLAAEAGVGEEDFDGEVLEPHVLRQGAHLLARHGEVDAAVERFARAEALVGAELEIVLRAEAGVVLADHDRLAEAEPRLRASIAELHAAGLVDQRVDAAGALARVLDRAGRGEDAEAVWTQHGPDA